MPVDKPYPIVTIEDIYPLDVNYKSNACNRIYFASGAMIGNQHLLQYNRAFVDMLIKATTWHSVAPPLQGMYTGDMFIPHSGTYDNNPQNLEYDNTQENADYPFVVRGFEGMRTSSAAYAFWQSFYNKRVPTYHTNGNTSTPALTDSEVFVKSNSLGQKIEPGMGYQLRGFGPENKVEDLIIRLPKPDEYYSYYTSAGVEVESQRAYVTHSSRLAFTPDADGNMQITLSNDVESGKFMFGNPTMANIDMKKFLTANSDVLAGYYVTMDKSMWTPESLITSTKEGDLLLAPMRSAMLQLQGNPETKAKSIKLALSADHLVVNADANAVAANMPARQNAPADDASAMVMHIYSSSSKGNAHCILAADASAKDSYDNNEDVLFFSSGVEEGVNSSTATSPVNMYTVSNQVPMMVDVRENIDTVPLSMLVHNNYRTEKVQFSFYLSLNWDKECYFCDAVTGARYRIMDGLMVEMELPDNHENRYFITGPDKSAGSGIETSTTHPTSSEEKDINIWAYSPDHGTLVVESNDIFKELTIYDLTGRVVLRHPLPLQYNSATLDVATGVCIVEAVMRDGSKRYTQAIVK